VIPAPEQLQDIASLSAGNLVQVPFALLLQSLAVHRKTLLLEVDRRQVSKKIVLEDGVPVDCRSNLVHETLGRYMVAQGKLTEADFTTCLGRSAARGIPLGEVLVEQKLVEPFELFKILQQNLAHKLLDLFAWREGEFRIHPEIPRVESSLKIRVPQLIFTGITRFAAQNEVDAGVVPLVGRKLVLHPAPPFGLAEIRLPSHHVKLIAALDRGLRIDELAAATALPYEEITRLLYALAILGVVTTADRLPAKRIGAAPLPAVASLPASPLPAPPLAEERPEELEQLRNEISSRYLAYRRQDPYDLLEVPEEATPEQIDPRFLAFAERYAPWRFAGHPELREKARDLFLAGARAYGELAERESRETLLFRRRTLREEKARRPDFSIKTDLLDPEAQFRKAQAAREAGKLREAIQLFEFASDCDPQNCLYRAELAWARFTHSPATAARQAAAELGEALRIDPRCGLALYYLGEVEAELGNPIAAEAHLQKAIKLMAPDRRPIEALKALPLKRK
jgi:tetratricopeptide (TPR) repeat protein